MSDVIAYDPTDLLHMRKWRMQLHSLLAVGQLLEVALEGVLDFDAWNTRHAGRGTAAAPPVADGTRSSTLRTRYLEYCTNATSADAKLFHLLTMLPGTLTTNILRSSRSST